MKKYIDLKLEIGDIVLYMQAGEKIIGYILNIKHDGLCDIRFSREIQINWLLEWPRSSYVTQHKRKSNIYRLFNDEICRAALDIYKVKK